MTESTETQSTQPLNDAYGIFSGLIDQAAVNRVGNAAAMAGGNKVTHVHMAFHSAGGTVPDGVALYNIFRVFPVPLTLYNIGTIASAGVVAYLGASTRVVSGHGTFMIHKTTSQAIGATSGQLQSMIESVEIDDARMESIYKNAGLRLTSEQEKIHQFTDLWLSSDEAVKARIANTVQEFAPPKGHTLFFLGPT